MDVREGFSPSCSTPFQLAFAVIDACTVDFFASVVFHVRSVILFHSAIN